MTNLNTLTSTELHIHLPGSFYVEDFMVLARPFLHKIDWHWRDFLTEYNRVLQSDLDPVAVVCIGKG